MKHGRSPAPVVAAFSHIPTRAEVFAAAAAIPGQPELWRGQEGPRWRLTVMPGAVQIGTKDYSRLNRSAEQRELRRLRDNVLVDVTEQDSPKRSEISEWSSKSRTNMVRTLCAVDYTPFVERVALGDAPAMVTLTLPGDWLSVAPDGDTFKKLVNRFRARYTRAWGHTMPGVWKLEFQRRGAPHLHILTVPPAGKDLRTGRRFREWLATTWADVVNASRVSDDGTHTVTKYFPPQRENQVGAMAIRPADWEAQCVCSEYCRNRAAGTGLDVEETLRYGDAKRIAVYFTKHGLFADKEYQNVVPEAWQEPGKGPGRFWGVWVLDVVKANVELADNAHYVK